MPSTQHAALDDRVRRLENQLQAALMQINTLTRNQQAAAEAVMDLQGQLRDHLEGDEPPITQAPPARPTISRRPREPAG